HLTVLIGYDRPCLTLFRVAENGDDLVDAKPGNCLRLVDRIHTQPVAGLGCYGRNFSKSVSICVRLYDDHDGRTWRYDSAEGFHIHSEPGLVELDPTQHATIISHSACYTSLVNPSADVLIVGGGVIGSSIALNLKRDGFNGRVVVVERDPSYQFAS